MKKKYGCVVLLILLTMPHAVYLMDRDSFSEEERALGESNSSASAGSSRSSSEEERTVKLSREFVEKIRASLKQKQLDRRASSRGLAEALDRQEGPEEGVRYERKSPSTWRKERDELDRRCSERNIRRSDDSHEPPEEDQQPKRISRASRQVRRSRSFLGFDQAEVDDQRGLLPPVHAARMSSLEDDRRHAWGRDNRACSVGEWPVRRPGPSEVTVINIPPGADLAFRDPNDPSRRFVVRSRPGSLDMAEPVPGVHGSGELRPLPDHRPHDDRRHHYHHDRSSRDRPSDDDDSPGPRYGDRGGRRDSGINYDQVYRFRNYPLVALLVLSFDRYPKTTLLVVGLAATITIWKYKAIVEFFEKAKEKTMGFENGKQNPGPPQEKISKKKSEWLWLTQIKQKICSLRTSVSKMI